MTDANDSMIRVHDRMPVMISRDEIGPWIFDDTNLPEFLGKKQPQLICEQDPEDTLKANRERCVSMNATTWQGY